MERTFNLLLFTVSCWLEHLVNYVRFKSLKEPKYNLVSSVVEPRVPEAFLARFPVAAYVLYCDPRVFLLPAQQAARCVGFASGRFRPTLARKTLTHPGYCNGHSKDGCARKTVKTQD